MRASLAVTIPVGLEKARGRLLRASHGTMQLEREMIGPFAADEEAPLS